MTRPTVAEINLTAIRKNLKKIKSLSRDSLIYPVVKANAYGHGYKKVVKEITNKNILCMEGPYDQKEFDLLIKNKIDIVFHAKRQIGFIERTNDFPKEIKVWIKIDTGMNRLGFKEDEIIDTYKKLQVKTKKIVLMSHFSSAAGTKSSKIKSKKQIDSFNKIEKKLNKMGFNPLSSLCAIPEVY